MKNKLLNFTICQMLVVIGMLVSCVKCQEQKMSATENVTLFDRSFEKVLSRRKRFLVWRPGSNLLLTGSLVKPLAFPRPGGHNLILEWDIFYPLPDSWRIPKKPIPLPPPPPPETTTPEIVDYHDHDHDHGDHDPHGDIWMPDSGWAPDTDVLKNINGDDSADRRYWKGLKRPQLRRGDWNRNNLLRLPSSVTQYLNPLLYKQSWQQAAQSNSYSRNGETNFNQQYFQSNRQSYPKRNSLATNKQRKMSSKRKGRSQEQQDNDVEARRVARSTNDNWEYHYAHRDRRDLYQRIESTSPLSSSIDVRSCLLRAICESQNLLHPPGYSLLQDMFRAVFTIPIMEGMDDDYSIAMQANDRDCLRVYSEKCPISILAFLLRLKT